MIDHPPPSDYGSPLPPYNNDSGVDVPSTSTADVSELEGKDLQREFDEIQIEGIESPPKLIRLFRRSYRVRISLAYVFKIMFQVRFVCSVWYRVEIMNSFNVGF